MVFHDAPPAGPPPAVAKDRVADPSFVVLKTETSPDGLLSLVLLGEDGTVASYADNTPASTVTGDLAAGLRMLTALTAEPDVIIISHSAYHRKIVAGLGVPIADEKFLDTLELARALRGPSGNRLNDFYREFGQPGQMHRDRDQSWSPQLQKACERDAKMTQQVFRHLSAQVPA